MKVIEKMGKDAGETWNEESGKGDMRRWGEKKIDLREREGNKEYIKEERKRDADNEKG